MFTRYISAPSMMNSTSAVPLLYIAAFIEERYAEALWRYFVISRRALLHARLSYEREALHIRAESAATLRDCQ